MALLLTACLLAVVGVAAIRLCERWMLKRILQPTRPMRV